PIENSALRACSRVLKLRAQAAELFERGIVLVQRCNDLLLQCKLLFQIGRRDFYSWIFFDDQRLRVCLARNSEPDGVVAGQRQWPLWREGGVVINRGDRIVALQSLRGRIVQVPDEAM